MSRADVPHTEPHPQPSCVLNSNLTYAAQKFLRGKILVSRAALPGCLNHGCKVLTHPGKLYWGGGRWRDGCAAARKLGDRSRGSTERPSQHRLGICRTRGQGEGAQAYRVVQMRQVQEQENAVVCVGAESRVGTLGDVRCAHSQERGPVPLHRKGVLCNAKLAVKP